MLTLKANQPCPYSASCQYNKNDSCYGAKSNRNSVFTCNFVQDGKIIEGQYRNPHDKTGQMKIIME